MQWSDRNKILWKTSVPLSVIMSVTSVSWAALQVSTSRLYYKSLSSHTTLALTHRADRFALVFPLRGMTAQTRVSHWSQRKAAENRQEWLPGKWSWCITGGIIYIKFTKQEWSIQCLSEHGKIEEGFRDVGTVSESGHHHPIIYCPPSTESLRCYWVRGGLWSGSNYISRRQVELASS